jgi:Kef-type K+ transport system membrane component KefB
MTSDIYLILTLSLLLWLSPFISKYIKIPVPVVEILAGSTLVTIGLIHKNEYFDLVAEVGFLYLMFLAGMEVNLYKLAYAPIKLLKRGAIYIIFVGTLAAIAGFVLKLNIIFIISIPLISIGLLASLAKTYGKDAKWIEYAFIVGVMGEIVSIVTLTVLDVASEVGFSLELFEKLAILFGFIVLIVFLYKALDWLFWWIPELKERLMPKHSDSEQDIRLSMALFFVLIVVMISLHLELALGAFIAGVAISAFFHHKIELEEKMSSFGFGFLVPLFFIHVGTTFDMSTIMLEGVLQNAILITVLSIAIKIFPGFMFKEFMRDSDIIKMALALSMPLTLLVAVATIGYEMKYITFLNYNSLILAAILEVLIAMVVVKILDDRFK